MANGGADAKPIQRVQLAPLPRVKLKSAHQQWARRNWKLTEELLARVVQELRDGVPPGVVCSLVGITEDTWYRWLKEGRDYLENGINPLHEVSGRFYEETKRAVAEWQKTVLARSFVPDQYKSTWMRDLVLLERRDRDNWANTRDGGGARGGAAEIDPDMRFL